MQRHAAQVDIAFGRDELASTKEELSVGNSQYVFNHGAVQLPIAFQCSRGIEAEPTL